MEAAVEIQDLLENPLLAFPTEVWGHPQVDERLERIKWRLLENAREIDLERARLTIRSYQQTEGQPMSIRRAKMLLYLAENLSITIHPDERMVGNRSLLPRMGVIAPEGAVDWVDRELDILSTRPQDQFNIRPEQIRELREEIFPYWRGKTLEDLVAERIPEEIAAAVRGKAFTLNQTDHAQGHTLPDVPAWLHSGIGGLREKLLAAQHKPAGLSPDQVVFYEAASIALEAAEVFIQRYAALAADSGAAGARAAAPPGAGTDCRGMCLDRGTRSAQFLGSLPGSVVSVRLAANGVKRQQLFPWAV